MDNDLDDVTSAAIAEETVGPQTSVAPTPVPEQVAEAATETAAPVQTTDDFVGEFSEPDYIDVVSDKDRSLEEAAAPVEARPLDPVIPAPAPVVPAETVVPVAAAPVQPQSVVAPPVAEVPAAPAPQAAPTPAVKPTPEEQAAAEAQLVKETMEELVKLYTPSPEEAAKLDEFEQKPSEYLPRLLAKAHQNSYAHAFQAIMSALPNVVQQVTTVKMEQEKAENAFLTRWPELRDQPEVAVRAIKTYKQMNPQASVEEAIERAGMLAMISIGKTPGIPQQAPAQPEVVQTPPMRPAMPGGNMGPTRPTPMTYEEGVFDEILRDEKNFGRG